MARSLIQKKKKKQRLEQKYRNIRQLIEKRKEGPTYIGC
jgi:hypothetical protein